MSPAYALAFVLSGLALGTFSSFLWLLQWFIGAPTRLAASILLLVIAAGYAAAFISLSRRMPRLFVPRKDNRVSRYLLILCLAVGAIYAALSMVTELERLPHGGWDAFAVWNVHARFLFRGRDGDWRALFDPALSQGHNEYPLLLPTLVSGMWTLAGSDAPVVAAILAVVFAALTVAVLCSAASVLAPDERGFAAGLLLLATPIFLLSTAVQIADIPVGLFYLMSVVLLRFADAWPDLKLPLVSLAGLSAGFAARTKNEGVLFVVAIIATHLVALAIVRWRRSWRGMVMILGGGLVSALLLLYVLKFFLAPSKDNPFQTFQHVASFSRYAEIAMGFWDQIKGFGGTWHTAGIHPAVLLVVFLSIYKLPVRKLTATCLGLLLLPVAMMGGYFMVYLLSSGSNVRAYISGSLDRLYLQLWPATLFILATSSLPPQPKRLEP